MIDKNIKKKIESCQKSGVPQLECAEKINEMNLSGDDEEQALNYIHEVYDQEQPIYDEEDEKVYFLRNNRIYWHRQTREGPLSTALCDFICHIAEKVTKDNGKDVTLWFRIAGTDEHGEPLPILDVKTTDFPSMSWVVKNEWALRATITPGQNYTQRLQHAIQLLSKGAPSRLVYKHTGWREIDGQHVFLTGGGAIGPDPKQEINVNVELDLPLQRYVLLPPLGDPVEAFQASRDFLNIGEMPVTLPVWTAMYMAPLTPFIDTSFTMWYVAASGSFKSVLTGLALSHFGDFDHLHLPANWTSTKNSLEKLLFLAKDMPFIIDDWYPGEDANENKRLSQTAGNIIRDQGNRGGRDRLGGDLDVQGGYISRGFLISSGEQVPGGHSQNARLLMVEMEKSDIDTQKLTPAQSTSSKRHYNMAMAHYISWISRNWETLSKELPEIWDKQRTAAYRNDRHARLAGDIASLNTALYTIIKFGKEIGVIDESDETFLTDSGNEIFGQIVSNQGERIEDARPSKRFLSVMNSLISSGKAVFTNINDVSPKLAPPGGENVGWYDNNGTYYFDYNNAYKAYKDYCQNTSTGWVQADALWKDIYSQGLGLKRLKNRNCYQKMFNNTRQYVIPMKKELF